MSRDRRGEEMGKKIQVLIIILFCSGCGFMTNAGKSEQVVVKEVIIQGQENVVPGTVSEFYVEPMIDSVEVPGAIDPKGIYYRPTHREIVEINSGRFEDVRYPKEKDESLQHNK